MGLFLKHGRLPLAALVAALPALLLPVTRSAERDFADATKSGFVPSEPLPKVERRPIPQPPVGVMGDHHLDKSPPRQTKGLSLVRNGWSYNCMECHKLIQARWHYESSQTLSHMGQSPGVLQEHKDIHLEHGNNRFCLNCHHPTNRNAFVDYDGSEIAQADVVQLCAKCHGTIYRDWKAGVHGRFSGFWKVSLGERTQLRCIQCHDPHSPKVKPMAPLAPLRYPPRGAHPPSHNPAEASLHR